MNEASSEWNFDWKINFRNLYWQFSRFIFRRTVVELEEKITQLQIHLNSREQELNASNSRICELTKEIHRSELDIQRYKHERDSIRKEIAGQKELCNKLDIEIEKLNAEIQEYSSIRHEVCEYFI